MEGISGMQMLIALGAGLIILILLIMRTKLHVFIALISAACFIGLAGGMPANDVIKAISTGFGGTLSSIGIIIGMGVMMGRIFEISGAAERMAHTFLRIFGKNKEEEAMALTGFIVSIPIFCDSGFVILTPLIKAISRKTKKSIVSLGIALAAGLVITHSFVPPTPGPLAVAGTFGIEIGTFLLIALAVAVLPTAACMLYGKYLGKQIYQIPDDADGWIRTIPAKNNSPHTDDSIAALPSAFHAFMPLAIPIVLILLITVLTALHYTNGAAAWLVFLGKPVIAVTIGLILAIYTLTIGTQTKDVIKELEDSFKSAGSIILITGAGGSLGQIIKTAGVGGYIASGIAASSIPIIILPFIIATLVRFVQGSGTVAMITAASITAPIVAQAGGNMVLGAIAACSGSLFFSYFNDSFYWIVNRLMGITETKEQIRIWSVTTTIAWAVSFAELLLLDIVM